MKNIIRFIEPLREQLGSALKSVILYGSCAKLKDFNKNLLYDFLFIVNDFSVEEAGIFKSWKKSLPRWFSFRFIIMSKKELLDSSDVFPIEYKDIIDCYNVIYGEDIVKDIKLTDENLRHQIEYELRAKKQRFQSASIDMNYSSRKFANEFYAHCKSLIILSKHFLRIVDDEAIKEELDKTIKEVERLASIKPDFDNVGMLIKVYNSIINSVDSFLK